MLPQPLKIRINGVPEVAPLKISRIMTEIDESIIGMMRLIS